jgi:hypothetical protein
VFGGRVKLIYFGSSGLKNYFYGFEIFYFEFDFFPPIIKDILFLDKSFVFVFFFF